ncbi:MAG: leucyl/phenylalanyl-tRNA--protein transferase [Planktomarina sp.]
MFEAYAMGIFPMAESAQSPDLFWVEPDMRGVIPLDGFHISRSLTRLLRKPHITARLNDDFAATVMACANRPETWINPHLFDLYLQLHQRGFAHSLRIFDGDTCMGGVFGIAMGGAFFGESMYSEQSNGSKLALAFLIDRLQRQGFTLFDTQFITDHLASLGAVEIPKEDYQKKLRRALDRNVDLGPWPMATGQDVLQRKAQMS